MICIWCKAGGKALRGLIDDYGTVSVENQTVIQAAHDNCRGGNWCDCQCKADRTYLAIGLVNG